MLSSVERGVTAGAVGGLAYGTYVAAVANPLVEHAESVVGHAEHAGEHGREQAAAVPELVTAVAGVGSGVLWGILLGAAFGLAFYLFEPALPGRGATKALVLAGAGFLTVSAVPWLVLPPAVPGVEQPVATNLRLAIYGALVVVGAALAVTSVLGYSRARRRHGRVAGVAVGAAPLLVAALLLPLATPTLVATGDAPAALVAAFRGAVALSQAGLWATIAASYCWLAPDPDARTGLGSLEESEAPNV